MCPTGASTVTKGFVKTKLDNTRMSLPKGLSHWSLNYSLRMLRIFMCAAGCPSDAVRSYLKYVRRRITNEGHHFISQSRSLCIFGCKVLGDDLTSLPEGFACKAGKNYPKFLSWFYGQLSAYSRLQACPKTARKVRGILTVLSFAYWFKLPCNKTKVLVRYVETVTRPLQFRKKVMFNGITRQYLLNLFGLSAEEIDALPLRVDFDNISFRPSAKKLLLRSLNAPGFKLQICTASRFSSVDKQEERGEAPFVGEVTVLDEPAGKTRVICAYSYPFIHSNGLYTRARYVLDKINQDVSDLQVRAKGYVKSASCSNRKFVSGDLSAFTDNISETYIDYALRLLGCESLKCDLFTIPVKVGETTITPTVLLMGLKGCFEIGSLCHHIALRMNDITDYRLCCDDIVTPAPLQRYLKCLERLGPSLNRDKTVISSTVTIFCGMIYWQGYNVKPCKFKLFKFVGTSSLGVKYDFARDYVHVLYDIYDHKTVNRIANLLATSIALVPYKSSGYLLPLVKTLPAKLGGLGVRKGRGLLRNLATEDGWTFANKSVKIVKPPAEFNRWFMVPIDICPSKAELVFPWTYCLLRKGSTLDIAECKETYRSVTSEIDMEDILSYYYFDVGVPYHGTSTRKSLYHIMSTP